MLYRVAPAVLAAALLSVLFASPAHAESLVPDVVGLKADKAKALISQAGYTLDVRFDAAKPAGIVFGQSPGGLATRPAGTQVTIEIGGAAPTVDVPEIDAPGPTLPPVDPGPAPSNPGSTDPAQPIGPDPLGPPPGGDLPPLPTQPKPQPTPPSNTPPGDSMPRDPLDIGSPPTGTPPQPIPTPGPKPTPQPAPTPDPVPRPIPTPDPVTPTDPALDALPFAPRLNRDGPEIPAVLGQTRASARQALAQWQVKEELTLSVPSLNGTVVDQWPVPGRTLGAGETVVLVIAVTKSPSNTHRSVPLLIGKSLPEIRRSLTRNGFTPELRKVRSRNRAAGTAVWQLPRPGSLAARGTTVIVHVGMGDGRVGPRRPPVVDPTPVLPPVDPGPSEVIPANPPPVDPLDMTPPTGPSGTDPLPPLDPRPTQPRPTKPQPVDPGNPLDSLPPAGMPELPDLGPPPGTTKPTPTKPVKPNPLPPLDPRPTQPRPTQPGPTQPPVMRSPLATPTLLSPPAGESYPRAYGATFEWSGVTGAVSYEWELQQEQPSGAWRAMESATVEGTRHRPERVQKGRYRWRVRATDGRGQRMSEWSGWFRLYMY